jgi:lysyl-tRNA synthetase class 2
MSDDPTGTSEPPVAGWPAESAQRLEKARALAALGTRVYPTRYERTHTLGEIIREHGEASLEALEALGRDVRIAGRVVLKRPHGKASFATLTDGQDRLQIYVRLDQVGPEAYRVFDLVDLGDFLGVAGRVMRTRKGELSVEARGLTFLGKALLPPPEKWHGLSDVEARYRQRYVDLMANPEVRRTFVARSAMIAEIRRFLDARGYVEVETPMMQPVAGGAMARPFVTYHNALGMDLFLRIAPELYLKRLVVGGLERVYEINRNFRNEGVSSMHNPEFTMLEFYTAYFDCGDVMDTTEALLAAAAARVSGGGQSRYRDREISFAPPFRRLTMKAAVLEAAKAAGLPLDEATVADAAALARFAASDALRDRRNHKGAVLEPERYGGLSYGKLLAQLFEDLAEGALFDPTFITDYPVESGDLAPGQGAARRSDHDRAVRALRRGHGDRQRLLGAQRPLGAAPALRGAARGAAAGGRGGARHGRGLPARPWARLAAHRGLRCRHRPPGHDPDRLALDPGRHPLPAHAARRRARGRGSGCRLSSGSLSAT